MQRVVLLGLIREKLFSDYMDCKMLIPYHIRMAQLSRISRIMPWFTRSIMRQIELW